MSDGFRTLLNVVAFYIGWFAIVLAAAREQGWLALAAGLAVVALHLAVTRQPAVELKLIVAAALVGLALETTLIGLDLARYAAAGPIAALPPAWLIGLWMAFATTFTVSLRPLQNRPLLAAMLGVVAAPLSYLAGDRLGGMQLSEPLLLSLGAIGLLWAVAFPMLLRLARHWEPARAAA
ncbi:MAG: DUF2878 domain-containing protein [Hyphomicrobium sp.]